MSDRAAFRAAVGEGVEAAKAGDLHPNDEAMKILDSFGDFGAI